MRGRCSAKRRAPVVLPRLDPMCRLSASANRDRRSTRSEAQKPSDTETPWRSGDTTGETARRRFDGAVR